MYFPLSRFLRKINLWNWIILPSPPILPEHDKRSIDQFSGLLMEDIQKLLEGRKPRFIVNPQILENSEFKQWLTGIQS